ncbi:peptidoglycan-binding protein [Streptomyces angustmyceticus]|uniref:peptidoglycan-binding protein n=1 Tax=Streptomyces angustmyceticus TaxID=285578 RepID=UPI003815963F
MTAPPCPHCSAPVRGDGRPACLCAAVDADDFDPLRVRPYVSLPDEGEGGDEDDGRGAGGRAGDPAYGGARNADGGTGGGLLSRGDPLDDLPGVDAAVHRAERPAPADGTTDRSTGPAAPGLLVPRPRRRPGPTSRTFRAAEEEPTAGAVASAPTRRRAVPAVLAAAGAAVAAAAVLISTDALSDGTRDRAAPPDRGTTSPSAGLPTGEAPAPTRRGAAPSRSATRPPPTAPTGLPGPTVGVRRHRAGTPPAPAPTRASGSVTHSPGSHGPTAPPTGPIVLREGAAGPEVAELQGRLRELSLYPGPDDGRYDAEVRAAVSRYQQTYGVTGDPDGVYGPQTRASLESRTHEP